MPKVSVVIPTYNRAIFLGKAIRSVLAQTYTEFEVIVVDDGSADDTKTVVENLSRKDSRVLYISHSENRGAQAARNTGCVAAKGEYIAFLDSDNEWLPDKLSLQMELFKKYGEKIGVTYCGFRVIYPDHPDRNFDMYPRHRGNVYKITLQQWLADTSTLIVRRDVLESAGYWNERIPAYQEWDMCIRLAQVAQFDFTPQILVLYYRHRHQRISNDRFLNTLGYLAVIEAHREEIVRQCGSEVLCEHYYKASTQFIREAKRTAWAVRTLLCCLKANPLHLIRLFRSEMKGRKSFGSTCQIK